MYVCVFAHVVHNSKAKKEIQKIHTETDEKIVKTAIELQKK